MFPHCVHAFTPASPQTPGELVSYLNVTQHGPDFYDVIVREGRTGQTSKIVLTKQQILELANDLQRNRV